MVRGHLVTEGVYGPGSYVDKEFTPVPIEAKRILRYMAEITPGFTKDEAALANVVFEGGDLPIIPGPGKSQVLSAVLHAMAAIVGSEIASLRGVNNGKITINTDRAGLYPATAGLLTVDGKNQLELAQSGQLEATWTDLDKGCLDGTPLNLRGWAIYPTSDPKKWYQFMTSLSASKVFPAYGIDPDAPCKTPEEAYELIKSKVSFMSPAQLDLKNMEFGFCGQTCYTPAEWRETMMGKVLAKHPLLNHRQEKEALLSPSVPFPHTLDQRPLAGIKIIELARVIAAPACGAALTSFGADVVRINSPHLADPNPLQLTLTAGKRTCALDLTKPADCEELHRLMSDADVVINAYRLRSIERRGFGFRDLLEMANKRGKGICFIDVNCYGPDGYYAERPGYQQIADAASGLCHVFGRAYGKPDGMAILPPLPVADMCTGAAALVNIMMMIRDRAKHGGSYYSCAALTSTNTIQLEPEFGLYSPDIVQAIQDKFHFDDMLPEHHVEEILFNCLKHWDEHTDFLRRPDFFQEFPESPFGTHHRILAPLAKYENEKAGPHWSSPPVPYCYHKEVSFAQG